MRILFFAPRIPNPPFDGGALSIYHQVKGLVNAGHVVTVVAPNTNRHHADEMAIRTFHHDVITCDVNTSIKAFDAFAGLLFDTAPYNIGLPRTPYSVGRFIHQHLIDLVHQRLRSDDPYDVIHIDYLVSAWYALELKWTMPDKTPPILYRAHNVEHRIVEHLSRDPGRGFVERTYRKLLSGQMKDFEIAAIRHCDLIATVSDIDVQWFKTYCPLVPCTLIPIGIAEVEPSYLIKRKRLNPTIGFLGSLEWGPNIEGLAWFSKEVTPVILEAIPNVEIHIAGKSPVQEITSLHDGKHVFIDGPVSSATEFLASVDVGVAPVISGSGVRVKILEGLAHELPMVTTSIGAEGLAVRNGEHVLIADNPEEFGRACVRLLQNAELASTIAHNGRKLVSEHYTWKQSIKQLVAAYESII